MQLKHFVRRIIEFSSQLAVLPWEISKIHLRGEIQDSGFFIMRSKCLFVLTDVVARGAALVYNRRQANKGSALDNLMPSLAHPGLFYTGKIFSPYKIGLDAPGYLMPTVPVSHFTATKVYRFIISIPTIHHTHCIK